MKRSLNFLMILSLSGAVAILSGCQNTDSQLTQFENIAEEPTILAYSENSSRTKYNHPLPDIADLQLDTEKVDLGNRLYHDTRLSGNGKLNCASCHVLAIGGDDNMPVSIGIDAQKGEINAPTTLNSGFNFKQFWDGRAKHLREQAEGPVENPIEMGAKWEDVLVKLQAVNGYQQMFAQVYPGQGITKFTVTDAIAEFERSLITPSPFDDYLKGDDNAISNEQKKGYALFQSYGCIACHQGINFGSNMMQKFGALKAYFDDTNERTVDRGLYNRTQNEAHRNVFKVPTLRNVEHTAPYFHDASAKTLDEAIKIMGLNQLGRQIPDKDRMYIQAFLTSLSGTLNVQPLTPPAE